MTYGQRARARLEDTLAGRQPDRVPVAAWGHFYLRENSAPTLAEALIDFQKRYDWDFVKINTRASYHVEGWGYRYAPSTDAGSQPQQQHWPIREAADWRKLRPLAPDSAALAEQIELVRQLRHGLGDALPLVMTIFSPLDIADKMFDRAPDGLKPYLAEHPEAVAQALDVFAETLHNFIRRLVAEGIDGIFFSSKWANAACFDAPGYARLARAPDLHVLEAAKPLWFNIVHLCEENIHFDALVDYPAQVLHWDSEQAGNPAYADVLARRDDRLSRRAVGGGLSGKSLIEAAPEAIRARAAELIEATGGRRFILSNSCVTYMAQTPHENLLALRLAVETD